MIMHSGSKDRYMCMYNSESDLSTSFPTRGAMMAAPGAMACLGAFSAITATRKLGTRDAGHSGSGAQQLPIYRFEVYLRYVIP